MVDIAIPKGFTAVDDFPRQRETLVNLFFSGNGILKRPGITAKVVGNGSCRGSLVQSNILYKVLGPTLTRINANNTTVTKGSVAGTADVVMAPGFTKASIIVKSGTGYTFNENDGLVQITDSNFKPSIDLAVINSITVYVPVGGGPLFFSDPLTPDIIGATSFFDAETLPDDNRGVFNFNNDLHVLGADVIEVFRARGDSTAPFLRVDGAAAQVGYIGGRVLFAPSFAFIGRSRGESFSIRIMGQGSAPKISNPAIDELLNEEYTEQELMDAVGDSFEWKGHQILMFRLKRHTLGFTGGNWIFFESGITGADTTIPWCAKNVTFAYDKYYVGDATNGNVGVLDDVKTDYGNNWEWSFDTFLDGGQASYFTINNVTLKCLTGRSLVEATIGLTISKDGVVWQTGNTVWRGLGTTGAYSQTIDWTMPGGLGSYENFAGLRFRGTADVSFAVEAIDADIE